MDNKRLFSRTHREIKLIGVADNAVHSEGDF